MSLLCCLVTLAHASLSHRVFCTLSLRSSVLVDILKNEGPAVLFRGFGPVMARAFPANAACFLGYEMALKILDYIGMP